MCSGISVNPSWVLGFLNVSYYRSTRFKTGRLTKWRFSFIVICHWKAVSGDNWILCHCFLNYFFLNWIAFWIQLLNMAQEIIGKIVMILNCLKKFENSNSNLFICKEGLHCRSSRQIYQSPYESCVYHLSCILRADIVLRFLCLIHFSNS